VPPAAHEAVGSGGACGGTALQIPTDAGEESTAGDEKSRCLLCGPTKDVELPDVGVEDQVVFEDAPAFETGVEDSPSDAPDSALPIDASGLLPPECAECLDKDCTTAYVNCFENPSCVAAIRCLDHCVVDGGAANPRAISCPGRRQRMPRSKERISSSARSRLAPAHAESPRWKRAGLTARGGEGLLGLGRPPKSHWLL
jgi:hypothetical protein